MIKDLPACLYLYSASPRRGELLKRIGIEYMSKPVDVDESFSQVLSSQEIVLRIAMKKLNAGLEADLSHLKNWGLAADTLVEGPTGLIGKPENSDEAESMLRSLSGIIHTVYTAVAVYSPLKTSENHIRSLVHSSQVAFRTLSEQDISDYVSTGEWKGAAGGYRIQEKGATLVKNIDGLWSSVMGLPLSPLYGILTAMSYPFG